MYNLGPTYITFFPTFSVSIGKAPDVNSKYVHRGPLSDKGQNSVLLKKYGIS